MNAFVEVIIVVRISVTDGRVAFVDGGSYGGKAFRVSGDGASWLSDWTVS